MIEIEKKFLLNEDQQRALLDGATELGQKLVRDSYFDTRTYSLTLRDFWFRERDGLYELKAPLASSSDSAVTNRYNEITDTKEIAQTLEIDTQQSLEDSLCQAGITTFVTIVTDRTSYEKQGFRIDIDSATFEGSSFYYAVAEIELLIDSEAVTDDAERRIIEFAKQFGLATDKVVLGKVLAYLKAERPEHFRAINSAKIIK